MSDEPNDNFAAKLKKLAETIDITDVLTEPLTESIENLLKISAAEMNSGEASVLVRDGENGDLRFLAAIGEVAESLLKLKIPAGRGIAGFVLSSGQPMAIADAGSEQSFYDEVDKTTGYSTQTILATPLRHNGEVIGVLEYVNRRGEPPYEAFSPDEMDKAAFYAEAVSALVNAHEAAKIFQSFGGKMLDKDKGEDFRAIRGWLDQQRDSAEHREMLELAMLLREVASRGDGERQLCRELLESILRFSEQKTGSSFLSY